MEKTSVTLTDTLARRLHALRVSENRPGLMLRVAVLGGGCSGFQYQFSLTDGPENGDLVLEKDGSVVVIDDVSLPFLEGATIDYTEDLAGAGFHVQNPNAASSCGCGTSFSV